MEINSGIECNHHGNGKNIVYFGKEGAHEA